MTRQSTLIALLQLLIVSLLPHSLFALDSNVKNLVVFGDSYSDLGNFHRWTNGPVWSENVAVAWNASLYSFAYTGSACDNELFPNVSAADQMPSIRDQIEMFYNLDLNLDPTETVFAVWVGINDIQKSYQQSLGTDELPDFKNVALCIGQQLRNIRKVFHASRIMVFNVPPLERMPFFADNDEHADKEVWGQAAVELNRMLQNDVVSLNKHHHALELDLVDVHSLLSDIAADPPIFGFSDATHAYLDACQGACQDEINDFVWWDRTHLTGGAHHVIANSILLAGSYAQSTSVDITLTNVQALLEDPKSRYRSPVYIPPPNTGLIDQIVQEMTKSTPSTIEVQQDLDDEYLLGASHLLNRVFIWSTLVLAVAAVLFAWRRQQQHRRSPCRCRSGGGLLDPSSIESQHRGRYFSPFRPNNSNGNSEMTETK
ncbi:hypothetical protein BDB00DRAFT_878539 [Zychaea mexicana]|uniref:uncharacterized protein n=1 Tax=Zychaea mexicana TaxID=64656 RepID=UPI0022FEEFC4|nr:uncharacterized protein BDB00DRAFT_878539 [Zychaea mexicana]KAI9484698.1 hypothetical protein BDB00DRAFT_878539 [Zychaea mexicana]